MEILENIYFNFFSISALITSVFHLLIVIFLFSIPEKSKATLHLGIGLFYMVIFNFAYFIASSLYHPFAAYHRWITVGIILLASTHMHLFMLNYSEEASPKIARTFFLLGYTVSFILTAVFFYVTLHSQKVYHFDAHYWDFSADKISVVVGIFILLYIVIFTLISIYKITILKSRERLIILLIVTSFLAGTFIPAVTNILSRGGLLNRELFQITWAICHILGFYLIVIIYINSVRDKTTLIAKINSITIVTFLMILLGISYLFLTDKETSYDEIHWQQINRSISSSDYRPPDLSWFISYHTDSDVMDVPDNLQSKDIDANLMKINFQNTFFIDTVLKSTNIGELRQFIKSSEKKYSHLQGYTQSLDHLIAKDRGIDLNRNKLREYLDKLDFYVSFYERKIYKMDDKNFRPELIKLLTSVDPSLNDFKNVIMSHLTSSSLNGGALKYEIMQYFQPLHPSGKRFYRKLQTEGNNTVSFMFQEPSRKMIYELGFDYTKYRQYIHPAANKLILVVLGSFIFLLISFRIFFLGILINPLRKLIDGVRQVYMGNLNVQVSIQGGR